MIPAGLSTRYREILTSGTPTAELEQQASGLYLRAAQSSDGKLRDELDSLTHWLRLGQGGDEDKVRRRGFGMVIALITTLSPTLADEPGGPAVPELSLDQALYYRGFEASSPLSTGVRHLGAAALRLLVSLLRSIRYLDDAAWAEFQRLLSLESMKTLGLVFAAWVAVTVVGGPLAAVANAALMAWGLSGLWEQAKSLSGALSDWWQTAYRATRDEQLDQAGEAFARAFAGGLITALEVVVTHRAFRTVEAQIARKVPTPQRLRSEYERAVKEGESQRRTTRERLSQVTEAVASGARGEGMRQAAKSLPDAALYAGGAAAVLGLAALTAWGLSESKGAA